MSSKTYILGWVIFIFHFFGAIGTIVPESRETVQAFTPFHLILSMVLIAAGHTGDRKIFLLFTFTTIIAGFLIEVIGVKTGYPFGEYTYGETLGPKILEVPVVIGVNWFLLSYAFGMLYKNFNVHPLSKIILAALSMVILDLLIEPVAILMDYWQWEGNHIPYLNYFGWFLVALAMQFCFIILKNSQTNRLIIPLIVSQIMYFTFVLIFY